MKRSCAFATGASAAQAKDRTSSERRVSMGGNNRAGDDRLIVPKVAAGRDMHAAA